MLSTSVLLVGCLNEEPSPSEVAMDRYATVIFQANDGFRTLNLDEAEIPFNDLAGEVGGDSGGSLPPGGPEISSGGVGGPEISTGGTGAPDISRGGTGSPEVPRGGVAVPGGNGNYVNAVCDFIGVVCERLVACSSDLSGEEALCSEVASICVPLLQEFASSITVPPAAFTYLQCITNEIRTSSCAVFFGDDGFVDSVEQCFPGGFPEVSSSPENDFDFGDSEGF